MTKKLRKSWLLNDVPVVGYYRHDDWFQISPAPANALRPPFIMGHHPIVIELCYDFEYKRRSLPDGTDVPEVLLQSENHSQALQEVVTLLSTITHYLIYNPSGEQQWFIGMGTEKNSIDSNDIQWGQNHYRVDDFKFDLSEFTMVDQKIPQISNLKYFARSGRKTNQTFDVPEIIDPFLAAYRSVPEETRTCFLNACSLFVQGLQISSFHPSIGFSTFVSAIESLIHYEYRDVPVNFCETCGQPRYQVTRKFQKFFRNYGSATDDFVRFARKVYASRSKILHHGQLMFGDSRENGFGSFVFTEKYFMRQDLIRAVRVCLVNWIISKTENVSNKA